MEDSIFGIIEQLSKHDINKTEAAKKLLLLCNVIRWVAVKDELPPILETIWLSNGKGWTDLGCRVETNEGWHWAGQNGWNKNNKRRTGKVKGANGRGEIGIP